jgi:DNA ligase-1
MITKPMLASSLGFYGPEFPVLATPKVDGFRFLKVGGRALTRSMQPVRNRYVREWIEANLPDGIDGEITVGGSFNEAQRALGREDGYPEFELHVFDLVVEGLGKPYWERVMDLQAWWESTNQAWAGFVRILTPVNIQDEEQLERFEADCLARGFEGVMLRSPAGPYKCGRSTEAEGYLVKVKRFIDAEAMIFGTFESVNAGLLGGFWCQDDAGRNFKVKASGVGDLAQAWAARDSYDGKRLRYRYQPAGKYDAPRFPVMLGIRAAWDLD